MLHDIRAISFDLDDTLWACDPVLERAERRLYDWLDAHCPQITARYSITQMREIRISLLKNNNELKHDLTELRRRSLRNHLREFDYPETLVHQAFEVFIGARNQVTLYGDVIQVLQRLKTSYRLVALTNGNADVKRIGIDYLFDCAISAADVQAAKPDAAMFDRACERLEVSSEQMLHVGDNPFVDIQGAHNAGVPSVWINRTGAEWPADVARPGHEINSLNQLLVMLGFATE
jgi:putative hydrolase of the HAD superfamily